MVERTMTNDKKELFKNRLMGTFHPDHNDKFNKTNFETLNNYNQRHFDNELINPSRYKITIEEPNKETKNLKLKDLDHNNICYKMPNNLNDWRQIDPKILSTNQ